MSICMPINESVSKATLLLSPPGRRWYYPRPADPIRPNQFSAWTARSLVIGMTRAVDADGAPVTSPDWNGHAEEAASLSAFLHFGYGCRTTPEQPVHDPSEVVNPHTRPTHKPNLWVSAATSFDRPEWIELSWQTARPISEVQILFDSALHFHFWQSWQGYLANAIPSIVRDYRIIATHGDGSSSVVAEVTGNHQRNRRHRVELADVSKLRVEVIRTNGLSRAQIYSVRAFGPTPP